MTTTTNTRPLTERIRMLRAAKGLTYNQLAWGSDEARSSAWFNKLLNYDPWVNSAPTLDTLPGLAKLLETTEQHVSEMVAEEWYGVKVAEVSPRVRSLAPRLEALSDQDAALVEALVQRLQPSGDS